MDRRPQLVAAVGFILQLAAFLLLVGTAIWTNSDAIATVARLMVIGLPIWLILFLIFKQMRRVSTEALETAELRRAQAAGTSDTIFEVDDDALLIEQNRLRWLVRWTLPAVTVIIALSLLIGQFVGWSWTFEQAFSAGKEGSVSLTDRSTLMMWVVVFIGFACFLYARYVLALAKLPNWRLLRAGAACMAGNALACLGLAIAFMATSSFEWAEPLLAYVMRWVLFALGIEFSANFILDFYRPRLPNVVPRPSFDSRVLGMISEPGGLAKSIADAVNYQFGFEVSSTWFYQLLQRWLFPLLVGTSVIVLALSSIVVVEAEEQAVVERFGHRVEGSSEILSPGLHFKWPFPIDIIHRAPVKQISELVIGEASEKEDEHHGHLDAILWTEAHDYVPEMMLLVASPQDDDTLSTRSRQGGSKGDDNESVPVSMLMVSVPIEYRIKNLEDYLYNFEDPVSAIESISYQFLSEYAASVDIHQLMGPGRKDFNAKLRKLIQHKIDDLDLGIEIVFVGLRDAHPPTMEKVAATFQNVVSAQITSKALISEARGEARKTLIEVSGAESRALALDAAIKKRNKWRAMPTINQASLAAADQEVQDLLVGNKAKNISPLSGEAAEVIAEAHARSSQQVSEASAKVRKFGTDVAAYEAAPKLYLARKKLETFEDLDQVRKYLFIGSREGVTIEYETSEQGALDRVLAEKVSESK